MSKNNPFGLAVPCYDAFGIPGPYLGDLVWERLSEYSDHGFDYIPINIHRFLPGDNSEKVVIESDVRGKDIYIIHPLYTIPAQHVWIGAEIADALRRSDSNERHLIEPYNPYYRQDHITGRECLTAWLVGQLYNGPGFDNYRSVFTFDAHSKQLELAFLKLENIPLNRLLVRHVREYYNLSDSVVLPVDSGGFKFAKKFADSLGLPCGDVDKERYGDADTETLNISGCDVRGKHVFIRDDILGTGSSAIGVVERGMELDARDFTVVVSHLGLYDRDETPVMEKLRGYGVDVIGTNTIPQKEEEGMTVIDISPTIAEILYRKTTRQSLGEFFEEKS
jgi:ribose-phosphate pyrophosphokinase